MTKSFYFIIIRTLWSLSHVGTRIFKDLRNGRLMMKVKSEHHDRACGGSSAAVEEREQPAGPSACKGIEILENLKIEIHGTLGQNQLSRTNAINVSVPCSA